MKTRVLNVTSAVVICLSLLAAFSSSGAQVPASPASSESA